MTLIQKWELHKRHDWESWVLLLPTNITLGTLRPEIDRKGREMIWKLVEQEGKALAIVDLDSFVALVFFGTSDGRPIPRELRLVPQESAPADPEAALRGWKPTSGSPISTNHIRGINLGSLQREIITQLSRKSRRYEGEAFEVRSRAKVKVTPGDGAPMLREEFRRPQNYRAAIERCAVSLRYEDLSMSGSDSPTSTIAREFFGGDLVRARNVVSAARSEGWLTPAIQGRPFGEATQRSLEFARVNRVALDEYMAEIKGAQS